MIFNYFKAKKYYNEDIKKNILDDRSKGLSYLELSKKYNIPKSTIQYMIQNKNNIKLRRGPKYKIDKYDKRRIRSTLDRCNNIGEKVEARNILNEFNLNVSIRTMQRCLKSMKFNYKNFLTKFKLTTKNKRTRVEYAKEYFLQNIPWNRVTFSDEKYFTLCGSDSFYSWVQDGRQIKRYKRVMKSPGLMVWAMLMPNGLISYRIMRGRQNSEKYVRILQESMIPIMKMNYEDNIIFQQDNCKIHVSAYTKKFLVDEGITILPWAPHSPDLNIIENVWKLLSDDVYSNGEIRNLSTLESRIRNSIFNFNVQSKHIVDNLYNSIPKRLLTVIVKRGDRIKY